MPLTEQLGFVHVSSTKPRYDWLQAVPAGVAQFPVPLCACWASGGDAPANAVAPACLLWQIRPGDPAGKVSLYSARVDITCMHDCVYWQAHELVGQQHILYTSY